MAQRRDQSATRRCSQRADRSQVASQGDSWVREWEGDPAFHDRPPLTRWDRDRPALPRLELPGGNEDILYFIFTFYNVTAKASRASTQPDDSTPPCRRRSARRRSVPVPERTENTRLQIPDTGLTPSARCTRPSRGRRRGRFSLQLRHGRLPFNMGLEYRGRFPAGGRLAVPARHLRAPFYAAPGFVGVKYLRSPESSPGNQVGLTMFSTFSNPSSGTGFPIPRA